MLVYTALETDQLKAYQEGFNKAYPDIDLKWVRDSTGVITAKLLAEKANPQADAVMGVAASSLALLDKNGMLEAYKPLNLDAIMSQYRDKKNPPAWFGMDVWGATVCFNTVEAAKKNIPKPETWKDLTKPVYKGQVVMPNPASSGTGFFDVTAWLTLWGDDNGSGDDDDEGDDEDDNDDSDDSSDNSHGDSSSKASVASARQVTKAAVPRPPASQLAELPTPVPVLGTPPSAALSRLAPPRATSSRFASTLAP